MKSIKARFILVFAIIIFLMTTVTGLVSIVIIRGTLDDRSLETLHKVAEDGSKYVTESMEIHTTYISTIALNPMAYDPEISYEEKSAFFQSEAERTGYLAFALVDLNGNSVVMDGSGSATDVSDRDYFQKAKAGEETFSDVLISSVTNEPVLIIASPIKYNGEITGVIYVRADGNFLSDITDAITYGETGYGFLINDETYFVGHVERTLVSGRANIFAVAEEDPTFAPAANFVRDVVFTKDTGTGKYSYEGKNILSGFAKVEGTPWTLIVEQEEAEVLKSVYRIILMLAVVIVLAVIIGVVIVFFVSKNIAAPIVAVTKRIEKQSELDFTEDEGSKNSKFSKRKDEIGKMMASMGVMAENIRNFVIKTEESAEHVAASAEELTATSNQTSTATEEVSKAVQEIAEGANDQARDTEKTAMNVEQLGSLLEEDATLVQELNGAVKDINNEKEEGLQIISLLVQQTEDNNVTSQEIFEAIMSNSESAEKIEAASGMIQNIADQTNLLALNAAIEAARAGDAGKGFAVVAEEIRNLAEQSNNFTSEIGLVIQELKTKSQEAVTTIMKVKENGELQTKKVEETEDKFQGIASSIDVAGEIIEKLTESTKMMIANKNNIIDLVQNLSAISEENAAGTQEASAAMEEQNATVVEIANASESLAKISQELQNLIHQFKL